eukprot:gene31546-6731_t
MASLGLPANFASFLQPGMDPSLLLDPNDPASAQTLAQLLSIQQSLASGQLTSSAQGGDLGPLSALVATAVALAEQQNGGGQANMSSLLGLDPNTDAGREAVAALTNMGMGDMACMGNGGSMGLQTMPSGSDPGGSSSDQAGKYRASGGRARKADSSGGNWMRRYHEFCYLGDKAALDTAKMGSSSITLNVQWVNMPEELHDRVPVSPAPIEVPSNITVESRNHSQHTDPMLETCSDENTRPQATAAHY